MKRLVFVVMEGLLAMVILSVGCTTKAPPAATPPAAIPPPQIIGNVTGNVSGELVGILENQGLIIVRPPEGGIVAVPIGPNTHYFLENQACKLEDVLAIEASTNVPYDCKIWYDDETGQQNIYIAKK